MALEVDYAPVPRSSKEVVTTKVKRPRKRPITATRVVVPPPIPLLTVPIMPSGSFDTATMLEMMCQAEEAGTYRSRPEDVEEEIRRANETDPTAN